MPRPMLRSREEEHLDTTVLSPVKNKTEKKQNKQQDTMVQARLLRKSRSKRYMEAMNALDAGGRLQTAEQIAEIMAVIRDEFPEIELEGILLGYVSICYLGKPYEVHTLDLTGQIIEHYKNGETLPGGMEKARGLALRGGYSFIEVYTDCCRAVSPNGSVSVIRG